MKYRPEIDGLRALAVIPVILFHAGFTLFSGGFVGVDVFFVISGYLITTILLEDIENARFNIVKFYIKRARRILPVLITILLFSFLSMIFVVKAHPSGIIPFSKSALSSVFFVANEYFWRTTGYFGATSSETMLLHLWTLSVEEQFYLALPIVLYLLKRYARPYTFSVFVLATIISFLAAIYLSERFPVAAFFSIVTRAWELGIGVLLAFLRRHPEDYNKNEFLSFLGLAGLIWGYILINENSKHPGYITLIPTFSTALLLHYSQGTRLARVVLENRLMIYIGSISFSLYLWHHIIFLIFKELTGVAFFSIMSWVSISAIISTILLSIMSYHFIEQPFRNNKKVSPKIFILSTSTGVAIIVIAAVGSLITSGFQQQIASMRYGSEDKETEILYKAINTAMRWDQYESLNQNCIIHASLAEDLNKDDVQSCAQRHGKAILVVGDSHALNLNKILSKSNAYPFIIGLNWGGCRPHSIDHNCARRYRDYSDWIMDNKSVLGLFLYHQSGSHLVADADGNTDTSTAFINGNNSYFFKKDFIDSVISYLDELSQNTNLPITWIGPFTEYRREALEEFPNSNVLRVNDNSPKIFRELNALLVKSVSVHPGINFVKWGDIFLEPENSLHGECFVFLDRDHYSSCGEALIADNFSFDLTKWFLSEK